jgi:hypothetical protein
MDDDVVNAIADLQAEIIRIRHSVSLLAEPDLKERYLAAANIIEVFARELDRDAY